MTAPTESARPCLLDLDRPLTEATTHRELLERQQRRQSAGPSHLPIETAREIQDTRTVESWLARQLRELPGGER